MMSGTCQGCGAPTPPSKRKGQPRKWCSERCRKTTLYSRRCIDCGAVINTDGRVTDAAKRCKLCAPLADPDTDHRIETVLEMVRLRVREALNNVEIGARLGVSVLTVRGELARLRSLGYPVPASPYRGRAVRSGARRPFNTPDTEKLGRELRRRGITPEDMGL